MQSRYYDPEICRFINADSTEYLGATGTLLSYNLFAYCENDPVDYVDPSGCYQDYAFTVLPSMNYRDIVYMISEDVMLSQKTSLKAEIKYKPFTAVKYYSYNAYHMKHINSDTAIYVEYSGFKMPNSINTTFACSTYYHKKTYAEWLLYVAQRQINYFEEIPTRAANLLRFSEYEWASFTNDIGSVILVPDIVGYIFFGLDLLSIVTTLVKSSFDKVSKYIMNILNARYLLKKSTMPIAIMWSVTTYKIGYYNSGPGYRTGWHVNYTYYAWNL